MARITSRTVVGALSLLTALLMIAPGAGAAGRPHKFLGVIASSDGQHVAALRLRTPGTRQLSYHGGPVMHTNTTYAIFWTPPGYSFDPGYQVLIAKYLQDVAGASGHTDNVYAVATQYSDTQGPVTYGSIYGGSYTDTDPLPASGCADPDTSVCLTDAQLQTELTQFISANNLPTGQGDAYMLLTPQGIGSCFDSSSRECAYTSYCAYHSSTGNPSSPILYANLPYADVSGCQTGSDPNGSSADQTIDSLSHEHIEMITDPLGNAWFDSSGNEIADKCEESYGQPLGQTSFGPFNQVIGGDDFYLQSEWSNASASCAFAYPSTTGPQATFTSTIAGKQVSFDASSSTDPGSTIVAYSWNFGDGHTGFGRATTHAYSRPGTYTVTLTVTDAARQRSTITHPVTIATPPAPHATIRLTPQRSVAGQQVLMDASRSSDPGSQLVAYQWNFGDGASATGVNASHAYASAGVYRVTLTVTDAAGFSARTSAWEIVRSSGRHSGSARGGRSPQRSHRHAGRRSGSQRNPRHSGRSPR